MNRFDSIVNHVRVTNAFIVLYYMFYTTFNRQILIFSLKCVKHTYNVSCLMFHFFLLLVISKLQQ